MINTTWFYMPTLLDSTWPTLLDLHGQYHSIGMPTLLDFTCPTLLGFKCQYYFDVAALLFL